MATQTYQLADGRTLTVDQDDEHPENATYTLDGDTLTADQAADLIKQGRRGDLELSATDN